MSLDDLDLEFEDEEAEKKSDAVSVDVDLEFGTDIHPGLKPSPAAGPKPIAKTPATPVKATGASNPPVRPVAAPKTPQTQSNIRPISPKVQPVSSPAAKSVSTPVSAGSSALKMEVEMHEGEEHDLITMLQGRIEQVEMDAQIKIAVAEFKTDILSDLLSDIKLLEHQIGGLLGRIHQKHPDLKQEVLMIKKLLADFSSKKRK